MPNKYKFHFLLLSLLITYQVFGQKPNVHHWTTKDGLPHNFLYHMIEKDNKIWIGTDDGMSVFNGKTFKTYSTKDGLQSPYVIGFNTTPSDSLYIFTWKGGIHVLNQENDSIFTYPHLQNVGANKLHRGIVHNTNIYGWQWNIGYYIDDITRKGYELKPYSKQKNGRKELFLAVNKKLPSYLIPTNYHSPISFGCYKDKVLVMGMSTQGLRLIEGTKIKGDLFKKTLGKEYISCIKETYDGGLLVGCKGKILKLSEKGKLLETYPVEKDSFVSNLYGLKNGDIVCSTNKSLNHQVGVYIDKSTKKSINLDKYVESKSSNSSIFVDSSDRIWIGTQGDGLFMVNNIDFKFIGIEDLSIPHILSINQKNDSILMFSTTNQVIEYNMNTDHLFEKLSNIRAIINKINNRTLYSYSRGSYFENKDSINIGYSKYEGENYSGLWFSEEDTIKVFDKSFNLKRAFHKFPEGKITQPKIVKAIVSDSILWVATKGALSLYEHDDNTKLTKKKVWVDEFASGERIQDILLDKPNNCIWIATNYNLHSLQLNDVFNRTIKVFDGMENVRCTKIFKDHFSQLWVGTSEGLSLISDNKLIRKYNISSGLISNYITTIFETSNNTIWIGTYQGIMSIPNRQRSTPIPPPIIKFTEEVYYSHSKFNSIKIPMEADVLEEMESLVLQYKLSESGDWIDFQYTELLNITNNTPGEYKLYIRGKTIGSNWSKADEATLIIKGYFWEHLLFKIGVMVLLIIGISYYSYLRIKTEKGKSDELQEILDSKNKAEKKLQIVRKEIAQDFHDEMGNKLASITVLADLASMKLKGKDKDTEKILNRIESQSKSLYNGTRDFIWSIDAKNDVLGIVFDHIKDFGDEFFEDLQIRFHAKKDVHQKIEKQILPHSWSLQMIFIFKEAMTNIAKYAHPEHVHFSLIQDDNIIKISITDDGKGFDIENVNLGNGIKNMKSRIKKMKNSVLDIDSQEGIGTTVSITFSHNLTSLP